MWSSGFLKAFPLGWCYGLTVSVPPKFICWNPNPHCDSIWKWELWPVNRSWGRSFHDEATDPVWRDLREHGSSFCFPPMALLKGVLRFFNIMWEPDIFIWSGGWFSITRCDVNTDLGLYWFKKKIKKSVFVATWICGLVLIFT